VTRAKCRENQAEVRVCGQVTKAVLGKSRKTQAFSRIDEKRGGTPEATMKNPTGKRETLWSKAVICDRETSQTERILAHPMRNRSNPGAKVVKSDQRHSERPMSEAGPVIARAYNGFAARTRLVTAPPDGRIVEARR
jgi:hypothetical protein